MAAGSLVYPDRQDVELFIGIITHQQYPISRFLPKISTDWYDIVCDSITYVHTTSSYEGSSDIHDCAARLLYKLAKRHELADGNKRSALMAVYLFYILNDYKVKSPTGVKDQAKRAAKSKGRLNEDTLRKRIAQVLSQITEPM